MLWRLSVLKYSKAQAGFTLLELIIVVLLLGVLAVYAAPRFTGVGGYSEYTYQNRLISVLRNMQIRAMQDSRPDFCHQVNFINTPSQIAFGPASMNYMAGNAAASCATSIDFSAPEFLRTSPSEIIESSVAMTVQDGGSLITSIGFNSLGSPLSSAANCSAGCSVSFLGQSLVRVCIESQGYIHAC